MKKNGAGVLLKRGAATGRKGSGKKTVGGKNFHWINVNIQYRREMKGGVLGPVLLRPASDQGGEEEELQLG